MLGLAASLQRGGASLLTFVKDNLKLYLDFTSNKSDTLKFPSDGSTEFDGTNDYISIADDNSLDQTSALTITCWAKNANSGLSVTEMLVAKYTSTGSNNRSYGFEINSSEKLTFTASADGTSTVGTQTSNSALSTINEWHHYAITFNSGSCKLYQDGVEIPSTASNLPSSIYAGASTLLIGAINTGTLNWEGKLANVAIWSRALEPEEIQSIQNKSYSQLKGVEKTSLVAWWALDSASNGGVQPGTGETSEERVTNGSFDADSDWSKGTGWSINATNGTAIADGTSGFNYLSQSNIFDDANALYKMTITIDSAEDLTNSGIVRNGSVTNFYYGFGITSVGTHIVYFKNSTANLLIYSNSVTTTISNISVKKITSNTGLVTGATTTTSVYGGNAPILPRAVDVAKEGQADNIGNGSALFDGSSDHVELGGSSPDSAFSITAWVFDTHASASSHFSAIYASNSTNIWFGVQNNTSGKVRLHLNGDGNYADTPSGSFSSPSNEWIHLACTWNGSTAKIYINGISQTLSVTGSIATPSANANPTIGINDNNLSLNQWDGSISQVGIWRGTLTQSQVQKVLESTSYSKIPSSVKSTLGSSEITSASNTTFSGVTSNNWSVPADVTKSFSNDQMIFTMDDDTPAGYVAQFQAGNFAGGSGIPQKFLKVTLDIDSTTTGSYSINNAGGSCSANVFLKNPLTTGINTIYGLCDGANSYFRIFEVDVSTGDKLVLNSFDVKEVINDIEAYYPLTESKHQAPSGVPVFGAVEDVTTGENLGSELFTGFTNTDCATFNYNSSTKELTATCDGSSQEVHASISIESGKTYRVEFTTGANYSNTVFLRGFKNDTSLEGNASSPDFNRGYFGTNNTYVFYTRATATGTKYIGFRGSSGNTIHITNFSVKKADSNMGLLL